MRCNRYIPIMLHGGCYVKNWTWKATGISSTGSISRNQSRGPSKNWSGKKLRDSPKNIKKVKGSPVSTPQTASKKSWHYMTFYRGIITRPDPYFKLNFHLECVSYTSHLSQNRNTYTWKHGYPPCFFDGTCSLTLPFMLFKPLLSCPTLAHRVGQNEPYIF